jgi:hypothetical protein
MIQCLRSDEAADPRTWLCCGAIWALKPSGSSVMMVRTSVDTFTGLVTTAAKYNKLYINSVHLHS